MTTNEAQHAASEPAPTLFPTDASRAHVEPSGIQRQEANDAPASNADAITVQAEPSVLELSAVLLIVLAGMATTFVLGAIALIIAIQG